MMGTLDVIAGSDWMSILPGVMMAGDIASPAFTVNPIVDPSLSLDLVVIEPSRQSMRPAAATFFTVLAEETRRLNALEMRQQSGFGDRFALQSATFLKMNQMRRGVNMNAAARGFEDRAHERNGRALAIGAADGHDRPGRPDIKHAADLLDAVEAERDRLRMQLLQVREPLLQGFRFQMIDGTNQTAAGSRNNSVMRLASLSRISRRSTIMSIAPCSSRNSER